jgi:hypothetical protein
MLDLKQRDQEVPSGRDFPSTGKKLEILSVTSTLRPEGVFHLFAVKARHERSHCRELMVRQAYMIPTKSAIVFVTPF